MSVIKDETETDVVYTLPGSDTVITIKKDDTAVDVHQRTLIAHSGGQTWQALVAELDERVL